MTLFFANNAFSSYLSLPFKSVTRVVAILLLILYLHNFAGYLAAFVLIQTLVRNAMELSIESGLPDNALTLFVFPTSTVETDNPSIHWFDDSEFSYRGSMYDVVRTRTAGDSTYLLCINDVDEERLVADLDRHVDRHMSGSTATLDSFQDTVKDSYHRPSSSPEGLRLLGNSILYLSEQGGVIIPESIFHPPHTVPVS